MPASFSSSKNAVTRVGFLIRCGEEQEINAKNRVDIEAMRCFDKVCEIFALH